jgi:hypothetical protein
MRILYAGLRLGTYASSSVQMRVAGQKLPHSIPTSLTARAGAPGESDMDRLPERSPNRPRRPGRAHPEWGPVIWIAILLTSWLVIAEWRILPELMNAALAAIS